MDTQGLTAQQLADMSGVAVVTVRDLCNGKRWPWTTKRNAIELALSWETGTIAQIAKGNSDSPPDEPPPRDRLDELEELVGDPTRGLPVRDALAALLECSELSEARQAKVVAFYLDMLEDQERRGMPRQRGDVAL